MSTRLVHIGDFHAAPGPRDADRYHALDQIISEGLALDRLGAWLFPGDLFDAAAPVDYTNHLDERLQRMADAAPVVLAYGNHDRPGYLDGFARLKAAHPIYVISTPHCLRFRLATGEFATVFVLPYPHKAGLVTAGVAPGDVVPTAADLLEPIFIVAAAELEAAAAHGDLTLMIGHVNVAGARLSNGQPSIGHEIELNPKHLDRLGTIPKLLNHVHAPQEIAGAHYAGSVCRLSYGEIEEKSYIVATYDESRALVEPGDTAWTIARRPIDVAPMYHIDGVLDRDGFHFDHDDWLCLVCQGTSDSDLVLVPGDGVIGCQACNATGQRQSWAGADVRVRYRYQASERALVSEQCIRDLFRTALRLKVEGVVVPDRALRSPEVAAARTLAEKIAAYQHVPSLAPSVAEKLRQLEHGDPLRLLSEVQTALARLEAGEDATVLVAECM